MSLLVLRVPGAFAAAALLALAAPAPGQQLAAALPADTVAEARPLPVRALPVLETEPAAARQPLWVRVPQALHAAGFAVGAAHVSDASLLRLTGDAEGVARGLTVLDLDVDLDAVLGIPGARLFAQHQSLWGQDGSARLGDVQGFSNIDAGRFASLYELYLEHARADGSVRWKAGRIDVNTEFAASDHAGNFLHPSMGISPTIFAAPTYPEPAPAVNLFVAPGGGIDFAVGAFFAGPTRARFRFLIAEAGHGWAGGRAEIGAWHTGAGDDLRAATAGWYANLDQLAWAGAEEGTEVAAFARFGSSDWTVTDLGAHLAGGVRAANLLPLGMDEELGLGASWAGRRFADPGVGETALEGYLRLAPASWFAVQGSVNHIRARGLEHGLRPGGEWVGTLRVVIGG